jgi:hypothetical protein
VFTGYKRKKHLALRKEFIEMNKIHAYRCHRLQKWRLRPMLIKPNLGKKAARSEAKSRQAAKPGG